MNISKAEEELPPDLERAIDLLLRLTLLRDREHAKAKTTASEFNDDIEGTR
jgi:hypothetical protein